MDTSKEVIGDQRVQTIYYRSANSTGSRLASDSYPMSQIVSFTENDTRYKLWLKGGGMVSYSQRLIEKIVIK